MNHRIIRVTGGKVAYAKSQGTLPDEVIEREIRALAKHIDLSRVVIHFKNNSGHRRTQGYAYKGIPPIANMDGLKHAHWRYLIVVVCNNEWIDTLAHEAKHVEQFRERLKVSELPARAFATWWVKQRAESLGWT